MPSSPFPNSQPQGLPGGCVAVPLSESQRRAPISVCVVVKPRTGTDDSPFTVLREELDGTSYLGCLTDAQGRILEWLQVRIQTPDCLLRDWSFQEDVLTNRTLDLRWVESVHHMQDHDPGLLVATGWEDHPPPPTFIDTRQACPWHPRDEDSGDMWRLCRDDVLLESADLPPYSRSTARYLYLPEKGERTMFVPVAPGSPTSGRTVPVERLTENNPDRVPLNPWAGFVLTARFLPTSLASYVDVLNGKPWSDVSDCPATVPASLPASNLMDTASRHMDRGRLFIGHHSLATRRLENLYLKLTIFQSALQQVRDFTEAMGRPLLNITDQSFHVAFGAETPHMPFLWTTRAVLTDTGTALNIDLAEGEQSFANLGASLSTPYAPLAARAPFQGHGTVRVRRVDMEGDGVVLEGTLSAGSATPGITAEDMVRFRLTVEDRALDISARVDEHAALAADEYRFRSFPVAATGSSRDRLTAVEGIRFPQVPYQVVPRLSSPCDLYSLGVLACRILLQSPSVRLAEILDELQGLSHQIGRDGLEGTVSDKVKAVFQADSRWQQVLGPQLLAPAEPAGAEESPELPAELWWELLAVICRLFPQMGEHSICQSFGETEDGTLYGIFDKALEDVNDLGSRLRGLLLNDFSFNEEVRAVIDHLKQAFFRA